MRAKLWIGMAVLATLVLGLLGPGCAPAQVGMVNVELLTSQVGGLTYVMSQALADIVNKNHPSIRVTVTESLGNADAIRKTLALDSQRQKYALFTTDPSDFWLMSQGLAPWDQSSVGKEKDARFVASMLAMPEAWVTLNPNIKSGADLAGKKVAMGLPGAMGLFGEFCVFGAWGLKGKVTPEYLGIPQGATALADGLVDAYWIGSTPVKVGGAVKMVPNSAGQELLSTQQSKIRFISMTKEEWQRAAKAYPGLTELYNNRYFVVPANSFGPGLPPQDIGANISFNTWHTLKQADQDVIYEITKVLMDHYKEFAQYQKGAAQWWGPDYFAASPFVNEKNTHPGALKAYKEAGVPIGVAEWSLR